MILAVAVAAFGLTLLGICLHLAMAQRFQLLDRPNHRSSHVVATPSSGGIPIIAALLTTLAGASLADIWRPGGEVVVVLASVATLCALGSWDDRRSLSVSTRLIAFFALSGVLTWTYWPTQGVSWLWFPAMALALAWLLNLYNFMDGIDGLAALQAVLSAAGLGLLGFMVEAPPAFLLLCAVTTAVYAGFLCFNWPPARLFMGDAGSLSGGYLLGWLGIWSWRDEILPNSIWLLLLSPFLLDTGLTLLRRAVRGERLTQAHNEHLYQRLARHWGSHQRVLFALLVLQVFWLLPLAALGVLGWVPQWTVLGLGLFPQLLLIAKNRRLQ